MNTWHFGTLFSWRLSNEGSSYTVKDNRFYCVKTLNVIVSTKNPHSLVTKKMFQKNWSSVHDSSALTVIIVHTTYYVLYFLTIFLYLPTIVAICLMPLNVRKYSFPNVLYSIKSLSILADIHGHTGTRYKVYSTRGTSFVWNAYRDIQKRVLNWKILA